MVFKEYLHSPTMHTEPFSIENNQKIELHNINLTKLINPD